MIKRSTAIRPIAKVALLAAAIHFFSIGSALSAPQFYTNEAAFLSAVGSTTLAIEGFEGLPVTGPTSTIVANDFTITNLGGSDINVESFPPVVTEGTQTAVWRNSVGQFVIDFDTPVSAVGFDITDLATFGTPTDFSVSVDGAAFQTLFSFATPQPAFNQLFGGIVDQVGTFSQLVFTNDASGDAVNFDRFQYSNAVPEPAGFALFGLSVIGLSLARRRRAT